MTLKCLTLGTMSIYTESLLVEIIFKVHWNKTKSSMHTCHTLPLLLCDEADSLYPCVTGALYDPPYESNFESDYDNLNSLWGKLNYYNS